MALDIKTARVRRVLLADGWHAAEDVGQRGGGSSFEAGVIQFTDSATAGIPGAGTGFSFVDHHTRKRIVGLLSSIQALEVDDESGRPA
jgi:hypothetical protein